MVVPTVSGMIGKSIAARLIRSRDSLLAMQKVDFESAFAFDRAMLLSLRQGAVAKPPEFVAPANFSGPQLKEVLGFIEAASVKVTVMGRSTAMPAGSCRRTSTHRIGSSRYRPMASLSGLGRRGRCGSSTHAPKARGQATRIARGSGRCSTCVSGIEGVT